MVGLLLAGSTQAFNMGDMMNPSKWMGGSNTRDRGREYYGGGRGYGGGSGYGGGPGYGGAPSYGSAPGYGPGPGDFDRGRERGGSNPLGMIPNPMNMFGGSRR